MGRAVRWSPTTKPVPELVRTTVTVGAEETGDGGRSSTRSVDGWARAACSARLSAGVLSWWCRWSTWTPSTTATATAAAATKTAGHGQTPSAGAGDRDDAGRPATVVGCRLSVPQPGRQAVPRRRLRPLEAAGDAVPQVGRGLPTGIGQEAGHLVVLGHLGAALDAGQKMALDQRRLLRVGGVERVRTQQRLDLGVAGFGWQAVHRSAPAGATPRSARLARSRLRPVRIRLLTVPSGSSSISATSR